MVVAPSLVEEIRALSRSMVRDWGFMGEGLAGADLSASAVHALIEIERGDATAGDIAQRLRLEKSSVSRMLRRLVDAGDVSEAADTQDSRRKQLALTAAGQHRVAAIHAHARAQVEGALGRLRPGQDSAVLQGLRLYSGALSARTPGAASPPEVTIQPGYQTGLIARVTQMHAHYYARASGFGPRFEAVVATGLAEFSGRLDRPCNRIWTARQGEAMVGSVAIDGEDLGDGVAHLRWFIVDDAVRGAGLGRRLLSEALAFADRQGFRETQLWTFAGLAAARHLYESCGFSCVQEHAGDQWGTEVLEQRFVRQRP